jgi:hypothetical protein
MGVRGVPQGAPEFQIGGPRDGKRKKEKVRKKSLEKKLKKECPGCPGLLFFDKNSKMRRFRGGL